jgi:hypothetical protein
MRITQIGLSLLLCGTVYASFRTAESRPLAGRPNGAGVAVADFDGDGQLDLASAGHWFAGPELRTPQAIPGPTWQACFASGNALLVIADKELAISEYPDWKRRVLLKQVSPIAAIDPTLGFVGIVDGKAGFANPATVSLALTETWQFIALGEAVSVAAGDINGDDQPDVLTDRGWYAAPDWTFHPVTFAARGQILCRDIDGDGLQDVVVAQEKGLAWFKQLRDDEGAIHFRESRIPNPPGVAHTEPPPIAFASLDYTDSGSLITGNGAMTYALQVKSWAPSLIDNRHGLSRQVVAADFDQRGYSQIVSAHRIYAPRIQNNLPPTRPGKSLFDGVTLGDWWGEESELWRAEDGEIVAESKQLYHDASLISDLELSNYRLIAQVAFGGDASFSVRGQPGRTLLAHQLPLAGVCWNATGWNTLEFVASGDRLLYAINGCPGAAELANASGRPMITLHAGRKLEFRMRDIALTLNPTFELLTATPNTPEGPTDLSFETGTLQGWTPSGDAFLGQPLAGGEQGHVGAFWIGTGAHQPSAGTLTSNPVKVDASHCSFLIGGVDSRVEILGTDGAVLHRVEPADFDYMTRVEVDLSGQESVIFRLIDPDAEATLNIDDIRFHKPTLPMAERTLDFDFESGSIAGWTATGDAFYGQPILGDTLVKRGAATSNHHGEFWVGSAERLGAAATGALVSKPFALAKPVLGLLLSGSPDCHLEFRANGSVVHRQVPTARWGLERIYVDLGAHIGRNIVIAVVDSSESGHICIDDIQFYDEAPRPQRPL